MWVPRLMHYRHQETFAEGRSRLPDEGSLHLPPPLQRRTPSFILRPSSPLADGGSLHHSVLSAILQGKAETTAVVQLWNPAQPLTGPVPETGSQRKRAVRACWTPGRGGRQSWSRPATWAHLRGRGRGWRERGGRRGSHGGPGHDGAARTFTRRPGPMSQVSGQRPPHCDAPHEAPSAASGPAQTPSLLPGLEVGTESTHPVAAAQEGSLEEATTPMPQGNGPGAPQALDSTDLDVPTEAVTCQPQGNPLGCTPLLANGSGRPSELGSARRAGNGALGGPKAHRKLQAHPSLASQGSKKSKGSTKSAASQIPLQAQEDCCVHCILSCLFCEFLTLCNIVLDCATCGSCSSEDSCLCCCCCGSGECADCDLPCDLDCGILDACCESADCLEICMECCGLCFSS